MTEAPQAGGGKRGAAPTGVPPVAADGSPLTPPAGRRGCAPVPCGLQKPLDTAENRMGLQKDWREDTRIGEKEKTSGSPLPYRNLFPSAGLSRPGNG